MNNITILKVTNGWIVYVGGNEPNVSKAGYVAETLESLHKIIEDIYNPKKEEPCPAEQ